ncbi:MAG: MoaD family protein [Desulfurococcales archaeon]|nr:MoaD family protein [Desulfurococcales archaeon]
MARVKVKTLGILYRITGSIEHELEVRDGATVGEVVEELASKYKGLKEEIFEEDGRFSSDYRILLNGREVAYLEGEKTRVNNGDEIVIIPPVGGG